MAHLTSLLLALACAPPTAGCVLPVPLQEESGSTASHPPQIVAGEPVDFLQARKIVVSASEAWAFGITVSDPDPPGTQTLEARLYLRDGAQFLPFAQIPLTASQSDATVYHGQTVSTPFCQLVTARAGPEYLFFVFVSDVPFPNSGLPSDLRPGHFDFKYWVVSCP